MIRIISSGIHFIIQFNFQTNQNNVTNNSSFMSLTFPYCGRPKLSRYYFSRIQINIHSLFQININL